MTATTTQIRTVLYGRTSIDVSEGRSVDDQLAELRRWAEGTGRLVVAELRDDGRSASRYATTNRGKRRDAWPHVMELITTRRVDELAVWEVSRSTRDRAVWSALIAACTENSVMLAVNGRVHDPADADDGFMLDIGAALAVQEAARISKRTQRAAESRAAAGRPHGTVPYGYRKIVDPDTGRTVGRGEHPDQAPVVREVARRLLARETVHAVAADLNRRGRLTKSDTPWRSGNLAKLVLRPVYAGLVVHKGRVLPDVVGTWPALITVAEHQQLREMFADPARDKFRNSTVVKHLGTGLFRCGREGCDGRMRVHQHPRRPNEYACRDCFRLSRRQESVDELVERLLVARLSQPDVLQLLAESTGEDEVKAAAEEVLQLKGQLREAREKVDAGELTLDDLAFFRKRWEKRLEDAERRARPRWLPSAIYDVAGPDAADKWAQQPIAGKRTILNALIEVAILPAGRAANRFNPDLIEVTWRGSVG